MGRAEGPGTRRRADGSGSIPPFHRFLEDHRAYVYRFLVATAGPAEADDCFQETFLAALRAYPKIRDGKNLRAWVLTIATRKAIDAARSRSRRPLTVPDVKAVADPPTGSPSMPSDPEDALWRAVAALPPRQRAAVVQRFVLDLTYRDIAQSMGSTEEAARANVHQGLKRLRREWSDERE